MIDMKNAKEFLANYVRKYDCNNGKIALKIRHIYRVAEISREIAIRNGLNSEEQNLAELIGLLHDIGRFEQIKRYNTFNDSKSENHAVLGVNILFEEELIKEFVETREFDEIIRVAILNHNKDRIEQGLDEKTELFCKIIRDADKLDIFYVLNNDNLEDAYGASDFSNDVISDEIYREFMEENYIVYKNRETIADKMVGHLAYVFDFNFDYCLAKVRDEKYIEKLVARGNYKREDTIKKFNEILEFSNKYINKRLEKYI